MWFVIPIVFGLIAAFLAMDRGRHPFGWFLAGFVVGPFSLAVLALPRKAKAGRFSECPACLSVVPEQARVCRYCATEFE